MELLLQAAAAAVQAHVPSQLHGEPADALPITAITQQIQQAMCQCEAWCDPLDVTAALQLHHTVSKRYAAAGHKLPHAHAPNPARNVGHTSPLQAHAIPHPATRTHDNGLRCETWRLIADVRLVTRD
jgi:hypothetical protein